ncbi:MAG: serine hydrolase [Calditrichia bacterium]
MKKNCFSKKTLTLIMTALFLAGAQLLSAKAASELDDVKNRIDGYLRAGTANGFSGAVLIAIKGKLIINKGYGIANKESGVLNTPNTVFDIGSNTKQFTGAAILKLVQFKKLKVSDPLRNFFPNLPADKQEITIQQLLTHSAGFIESIGRDFDTISTEAFFEELYESKLLHQPGATYSYSNTGYSILARIIELVSGQSYESFLNEHLFKPAGLNQTGYLMPEWNGRNLARGYNRNVLDMGSMVTRYQEDGTISWHLKGNGGINSTQQDMHKWFNALKSHTVLPESLFYEFTTPRIGPKGGTFKYAYGWGVRQSKRNTAVLSHNGSNGPFSHTLLWLPEEDVLIIYATNANSPSVERLAYTIKDMIFDQAYSPEPIKKNVYYFIREYTQQNRPEKSPGLLTYLNKAYIEDISNPDPLNRIGYLILRVDNNVKWALELFKLNSTLFPEESNVWDSLGDGYLANDEKAKAIASFKKAVKLGSDGSQEKLNELMQ